MGEQKALFPSSFDLYKQKHPEKFEKKKRSRSGGRRRSSGSSSASKVYDCNTCGLSNKCRHPKMGAWGWMKKRILFVGSCPSQEDDRYGVPFSGSEGVVLRQMCAYLDISLQDDCACTFAVRCFKDSPPKAEQVKCCHSLLEEEIKRIQPELIICLGQEAINSVLSDRPKKVSKLSQMMMHGIVIPSHKYNCWVGCSYGPDFFLSRKRRTDVPDDVNLLLYDIAKAVGYLGKPLPQPLSKEGNILCDTVDSALEVLCSLAVSPNPVAYDYETTRLTPYERGAQLVSLSLSDDVSRGWLIPLHPELVDPLTGKPFFTEKEVECLLKGVQEFLAGPSPKVVQNLNMEEVWNVEALGQPQNNFIHDTMIGAHILHCSTSTTGLAFQAWEMTGHDYKSMVDLSKILSSNLDDLLHYNCWDARYTLMAYYHQVQQLSREGRLGEFNDLLQHGAEALVNLRIKGVQIDMSALESIEKRYSKELDQRAQEMQSCSMVRQYEVDKDKTFNPESAATQIGGILYDYYKETPTKFTKTKRGSTDVEALEGVLKKTTNPEVKRLIQSLFRFRKCGTLLKRARNYRAVMDSKHLVHPCYNLNKADTYRSSADRPNIQNVFKHDKELKKFRRVIVPSPGRILLEVDYSSLEVRVIDMASGDLELLRQIREGVDTHRRWASEIYQKPELDITSDERYEAKNGFVFASFYGAVPDSIQRKFPTVPKGHIHTVQAKLWSEFQGVREWQLKTIETYKTYGYVEGMSGFRRYGPLNINKIYNTPIQGPAFHLMLDALSRIDLALAEAGLRTVSIFEIHDSITFDCVPEEAPQVVRIVTDIMTSKRFDWQGEVPLEVEWEVGIGNWYDLAEMELLQCQKCNTVSAHSHVKKRESDVTHHTTQCALCRTECQWDG